MKGGQVVLGRLWGREAAALLLDGVLADLFLDPAPLTPFAPGAILRGRIERLLKGQGGVFVRLPGGATGYLRDRSGLAEGRAILVQVAGIAEPGKAVPLTTRLLLRGRTAIVTPGAPGANVSRRVRDEARRVAVQAAGMAALAGRTHGLILRSAAEAAEDDAVTAEAAALADLADRLAADAEGPPELLLDAPTPWEAAWIDWSAPDLTLLQGDDAFAQAGVDAAIDALLRPAVTLPGGAGALVEPTRALVAIDVNTGADTTPAAALKADIALARDLPRQLRLRGLGGQVVIDFAPIPRRDRATLDQVLRAAFRGEAAETSLVGWTAMGLYELSRKRDRPPLAALAAAGTPA